MSRKSPAPDLSIGAQRAIYSGRDRLGTIIQHGKEFVARDRFGNALGRYDSAIEAANAVSRAAMLTTGGET